MNRNMQISTRETWVARVWRILGTLDEAISTDRVEYLERRLSAVEQKVWDFSDLLADKSADRRGDDNASAD